MKKLTLALLSVTALSFSVGSLPVYAQGADLTGSWSGGGTVTFAGGNRERARCRVRYSSQAGGMYSLTGVCATDTGRVEQTATLRKTGANTYAGNFLNPEFGVSGVIRVTVSGNSQTATINSDGGSAQLTLRKQ